MLGLVESPRRRMDAIEVDVRFVATSVRVQQGGPASAERERGREGGTNTSSSAQLPSRGAKGQTTSAAEREGELVHNGEPGQGSPLGCSATHMVACSGEGGGANQRPLHHVRSTSTDDGGALLFFFFFFAHSQRISGNCFL